MHRKPPMTLKHLRRLVNRMPITDAMLYTAGWQGDSIRRSLLWLIEGWEIIELIEDTSRQREYNKRGVMINYSAEPSDISAIDRAISILGPDWPVREKAESRPKNTNDVEGSTQSGDQTHGGDGASGEVDAPAISNGNEANDECTQSQALDSAGNDSAEACQAGKCSEQSDGYAAAGDGQPEVSPTQDEPTEGSGDSPLGLIAADSDTPDRDDSVVAGESANDEGAEQSIELSEDNGEATSPIRPKNQFGGIVVDAADIYFSKKCSSRATKDVARALRRLFAKFDIGGIDESPRVDGRKLIKEIHSRRYQLSRAVRRETQQATILSMADVSGSCSAAAAGTVEACCNLTEEIPNLIVIIHSNGAPVYVINRGRFEEIKAGRLCLSWYDKYIFCSSIAGCIAFGDWDAGDLYKQIAMRCPFIWLDSFAACDGVKPVPKNGSLRKNMDWEIEPFAWWQGVNDEVTAAIALRQTHKKL